MLAAFTYIFAPAPTLLTFLFFRLSRAWVSLSISDPDAGTRSNSTCSPRLAAA